MIQELRCQVKQVTHHAERVYSLELEAERELPGFLPGQYLKLAIEQNGELRPFSIASAPGPNKRLRVIFAAHGRFSTRMENELRPGSVVWVQLPFGDFVIRPEPQVVLVAGGTGIAAFLAFLEGLQPGPESGISLVYGARRVELLLGLDRLQNFNLRQVYFLEQPNGPVLLPGVVQHGPVSVAAFWEALPDPARSTFYISGPPAMLKTVVSDLRLRGVASEHIRYDAWEPL